MEILFEVLSVIWITISSLFEGIFAMIIENLPLFMEMKQVLGMFTPAGMIALYLGVPTIVVSVGIALIKKLYIAGDRDERHICDELWRSAPVCEEIESRIQLPH